MYTFFADYKNEIRKLSSRKKFYVFLGIEIAICAMVGLISLLIGRFSDGMISNGVLMTGLPMSILGFFLQIYIPLIIFMAAVDMYTAEVADGTIRFGFMRPVSRAKQYFARAAAIATVALCYLVVLFVLTAAMQYFGTGITRGLVAAFASYFVDIVPMLVMVLFAALLCQFGKSTSLSMLLCIVVYIALAFFGLTVPQAGSLLFTGYLGWHSLWVGTTLPFGAILTKSGLLIGYGIVLGTLGYMIFEKREV